MQIKPRAAILLDDAHGVVGEFRCANIRSLAAYERARSRCDSVTLEEKQHSVVFLHSHAVSLRALRGVCELPHLALRASVRSSFDRGSPKQKGHRFGCPFVLVTRGRIELPFQP